MSAHLSHIRALICDVDGSLCSGQLWYGDDAQRATTAARSEVGKFFHVHDGHRIVAARRAGLVVGLCSGRDSQPLRIRARDLGLDPLMLGVRDKCTALAQWSLEEGIDLQEVAFLGDDYPDLPLLGRVGCLVAPRDAAPAMRRRADLITHADAGCGAVAEVLTQILRARGQWPPAEGAACAR